MIITANESADEAFLERVAICIEDGQQTEDAAIHVARMEKRARDRKTRKPKQSTMKWGK